MTSGIIVGVVQLGTVSTLYIRLKGGKQCQALWFP